jgi:hypothetical protein
VRGLPHGGVPQIVSPHQPLPLLIDQINVDLTPIIFGWQFFATLRWHCLCMVVGDWLIS